MPMNTKDTQFFALIDDIEDALAAARRQSLASEEAIDAFTGKARSIRQNLESIKQEGRLLKLGIVGCVKAGKSTLLNALLFEGRDILPKAATPMTAALTRISYAEQPEAHIVFYGKGDWSVIENNAKKFRERIERKYLEAKAESEKKRGALANSGVPAANAALPVPDRNEIEKQLRRSPAVPEEEKACDELVTMARRNGVRLEAMEEEITIPGGEDFQRQLNEYVGANGKYTPLVNYIELKYDYDFLKGIEIVDTPGLNDPIKSRERATLQFLDNFDVVLVISAVGQFLDSSSVELLRSKLQNANVREAYVVGSQLDSGLRQYRASTPVSFAEAFQGSLADYGKQAEAVLGPYRSANGKTLMNKLARSEPVYVSAQLYSIAQKQKAGRPLTEEEAFTLRGLQAHLVDFRQVIQTPEDMVNLSNIGAIRDEVFTNVLHHKEPIIAEKIATQTESSALVLGGLLETINIESRSRRNNLAAADVESLEKKKQTLARRLDSVRESIRTLFLSQGSAYAQGIQDIKIEIGKEISFIEAPTISERKEHHSTTERYGFLGWMRRTVHYDETIKEANIGDVEASLLSASVAAQQTINENLAHIFDREKLRNDIKNIVLPVFDLEADDFDENEILQPLNALIDKLSFREVKFDYQHQIEQALLAEFPETVVEGQRIHALRHEQVMLATQLLEDMSQSLDVTRERAVQDMTRYSQSFIDDIDKHVRGDIAAIEAQLADKQKNLALYDAFIERVAGFKAALLETGADNGI